MSIPRRSFLMGLLGLLAGCLPPLKPHRKRSPSCQRIPLYKVMTVSVKQEPLEMGWLSKNELEKVNITGAAFVQQYLFNGYPVSRG